MTNITVQYSNVAELVKALGRPLTIFDLETTTFRGRDNFGITEVACFTVTEDGAGIIYSHLINPERTISAEALAKTRITPTMVRDKETWGVRYASLFSEIAKSHWAGGFNNRTFDCPAVLDMNERYGAPIEGGFSFVVDLYRLYLALEKPESKKGNLMQVGELYGVKPKGDLHRARADVILTVETLDAMLLHYGVEAVIAAMQPAEKPASAKKAAQEAKAIVLAKVETPEAGAATVQASSSADVTERIQAILAKGQVTDVSALAKELGMAPKAAALELSRAVDEGRVNPMPFVNEATLQWLRETLVDTPTDLLLGGRLKPIYDHLVPLVPQEVELDYLQLRIGLMDSHLRWVSLKAPLLR